MDAHKNSVKIINKHGLLLYHHQYSYFSQKVLMALYEKKLPFDSFIIDLTKSVQYERWFLQINPRGEVPVLQDNSKIIPDSTRIIDYLEDNFCNGDIPRLIPMDHGHEVRQKVTHFRHILDQAPSGVLTMGSFIHTDLVKNPKVPFKPYLRNILIKRNNSADILRSHAEKNPSPSKEILLQKAELQEKKHKIIRDRNEFLIALTQVDDILNKVEQELSTHSEDQQNWWLCCDLFTVADISLTILLVRLDQLGFAYRFWKDNKRPLVEKYYERVRQRKSYKKTIPNTSFHIKMFINAQKAVCMGVTALSTVTLIVGGFYLFKYLISA